MSQTQSVAIVGAGLAGLALALSLHQQGIKSTVYESRPEPLNIGGAVMLSPNALRILDSLNMYQSIKNQGYNFDSLEFRTVSGDVIDVYAFGDEAKYGYQANRIYRFELIDIMLEAIRSNGINVVYGMKFAKVLEETNEGVKFEFTDGTQAEASILVGADGIHSTVRKYMYSGEDYAPRFIGQAGITAAVPASNLPKDVKVAEPITIMSKKDGAFVLAPQKVDGSELLIGKQKRIPGNPSREEWDAIFADKEASVEFLQKGNEVFGPMAVGSTSQIALDKINIWPFYVVPKLEKWASEQRRVVLVGDAAHAIPPSAGQGISQAMEDVFMLALLVGEVGKGHTNMKEALGFWQQFRQDRVGQVLQLNARVDQRRLPRNEGDAEVEKEEWELSWLYDVDIKKVVSEWIVQQS